MCVDLHLLADCTSGDIVFDKYCYAGPPVVPVDQFEGFQMSGVSFSKGVMVSAGDFVSQGYIWRDVASVFKE